MITSRFNLRLSFGLIAVCLGISACSSKIHLSSNGVALWSAPVNQEVIESSWSTFGTGTTSPSDLATYNSNVRRHVHRAIRKGEAKQDATSLMTNGNVYHFNRIDQIRIADAIEIENGIKNRTTCPGIGVPLLGRVRRTESDLLIPETGLWIPLTAVMKPHGDSATLYLLDPTHRDFPEYDSCPIAFDMTAPLARDLLDRQKHFQKAKALVNFEKFAPQLKIERVFSFDPEKIPVLMVHGIFSSPITWTNTMNELMADPEIRKRFELWTFSYPTGAPVPYLAQRLREEVKTMMAFRAAHGAREQRLVVLGHSMGGVLSKFLTQRSGQEQWRHFYRVPPEELDIAREDQELLRNMFFFEPLPYIERVIFAATPHKGSRAAEIGPVQFAESLIRTPTMILSATQNVLLSARQSLTPLGSAINQDFPSSIDHLRQDSELGVVFSKIPLNPSVKYHSIIGSRCGPDVPLEEVTDGIVSWKSAHIEGVESETIVRSRHSVHASEQGVAEITRILKLVPH